MISAIDGDIKGDDIDRFRIKIWDKDDNDVVVYDNQMGDEDDADATDAIEGGSIVIHEADGLEKKSIFSEYVDKMVIYPLKYLIPLHLWPPFAFSYDVMGEIADDVSFQDIVMLHERFVKTIREDIGIPGIPDYYWSIAKLLKKDVVDFTKNMVIHMMTRNYRELEKILIAAKTV